MSGKRRVPAGKRRPGRPLKWTPTAREELLIKLQEYIDTHDIPILKEFASMNHILSTQLYEYAELSDGIKACHEKKEVGLEREMLSDSAKGRVAGYIFSLKQLGWTDKQEVEHSGEMAYRVIPAEIPTADDQH